MWKTVRRVVGALLIITALILTQIPYTGVKASSDDFLLDGSTLVRYVGTEESVSIPDAVKIIGEEAFAGCETVVSVRMGGNVREIRSRAFADCPNLVSVEVSDSVRVIESAAFRNCEKLETITLGTELERIGSSLFSGDYALHYVSESSPNFTIVDSVIYDDKLETLYEMLPNRSANEFAMPNSVIEVAPFAFYDNAQLYICYISENLQSIGDYAFAGAKNLQVVYIPYSVNRIQMKAFADCPNLKAVRVPLSVQFIHNTAFDGSNLVTAFCEPESYAEKYFQQKAILEITKSEYEDITQTVLDNSVTEEEANASMGDETEEDLTDAEGDDAASGENQGDASGSEATDVPSLETPEDLLGKVMIAGKDAVVFIDNTKPVVYTGTADPTTPPSEGGTEENPFPEEERTPGIYDGDTITLPFDESNDEKGFSFPKYTIVNHCIAAQACYLNQQLDTYSFPKDIVGIGDYSFARSALTSIQIPEGVTEIGYGAFYHCDYLEEVSIPATVTDISAYAFDDTKWLNTWLKYGQDNFLIVGDGVLLRYRGTDVSNIYIPDGVKTIAPRAFYGHDEITAVDFPADTTVIGDEAFMNCSNLKTMRGGSNLVKIGDRAFEKTNLEVVRIPANVTSVGLKAFSNVASDALLVVQGTVLPNIGYGMESTRLSNLSYRNDAFENVKLALISNSISNSSFAGTILDPTLYGFHGLVVSILTNAEKESEGAVTLRLCTLRPDENGVVTVPDTILIYGKIYRVAAIDATAFDSYLNSSWIGADFEGVELPENLVNYRMPSGVKNLSKPDAEGFDSNLPNPEITGGGESGDGSLIDQIITAVSSGGPLPIAPEVTAPIEEFEEHTEVVAPREMVTVTVTAPSLKNQEVVNVVLNGSEEYLNLSIIESDEAAEALKAAYRSLYGEVSFQRVVGLDMTLWTDQQIQITRLGKNKMTIVLPVPISSDAEYLHLMCFDEDGQLESIPVTIVERNGVPCVKFQVSHFSYYALYEFENHATSADGNLDASPDTGDFFNPKLFLEIGLAALGVFLILWGIPIRRKKEAR